MTEPEVTASFTRTNEVCNKLMTTLMQENTPVGYAILGCALTLGRLFSPDVEQSDEDEIKFVEDLTEWAGAYWQKGLAN